MKILSLEFSSAQRSVALWNGGGEPRQIIDPNPLGGRGTRAFALLDELLAGDRQVDLLAIGLGPGSYTGIRAALSIAQGWQLALGVPVAGVSSMDALAREVPMFGRIHLAVDAHRGEFYLASYQISAEGATPIEPLRLAAGLEIKALIEAGQPIFGPELPEQGGGGTQLFPSARAVALLAAAAVPSTSAEQLEPIYLRPISFNSLPKRG